MADNRKRQGRCISWLAAATHYCYLNNNNALFTIRRISTAEVDTLCPNSPQRFRLNQIFDDRYPLSNGSGKANNPKRYFINEINEIN